MLGGSDMQTLVVKKAYLKRQGNCPADLGTMTDISVATVGINYIAPQFDFDQCSGNELSCQELEGFRWG